MIAMPSSSTAMMNVSRNWPSGIIGRMDGASAASRPVRAGSRSVRSGVAVGAIGLRRPVQPPRADGAVVQRLGKRRAVTRPAAAASTAAAAPSRGASSCELRRRAAAERVAERAADHLVDVRLIAEADLRLRRMHVDVHARRAASR